MGLLMPTIPNIFKHSKEVETGMSKTRLGEIIVSMDGKGDFDNLEEAIRSIPNGGRIILKAGTYVLYNQLQIPSNTTIIGEGNSSIIKTQSNASYWISMLSKTNILLENLCFYLFTTAGTEAPIDIDASDKITFEKVLFQCGNANMDALIWSSNGNTAMRLKILNCNYTAYDGGGFHTMG